MNDTSLLLFAGIGAFALYVYNVNQETPAEDTAQAQPLDGSQSLGNTAATEQSTEMPVCPSGTVLMYDQTCCDSANVLSDGTCGECPQGFLSAVDSSGSATCCPSANIDGSGICQVCPIGTSEDSNGSCSAPTSSGNPLDISTGSVAGDIASQVAIGLVAGVAMDQALDRGIQALTAETAEQAAERVAREAAERASREAAEKLAKEAAEKVAQELAEKAAREAGEMLARKASVKAAQKFATKVASRVGAKLAAALARATAYSSTIIGAPLAVLDLMMTAISIALVQTLSLDEDSFEPNGPNQFSLSQLPDWAQTLLSSIPYIGNIIDILAAPVVTTVGCSGGKQYENGLCYDPPRPGWQCEAFLCYKDYPDFENNSMLHTRQNITKKILVDTGTVPDMCPPGQVKDGGFCYDNPGDGWSIVGGTAWGSCPAGSEDQGALCSNLTTDTGRIPNKAPCGDGLRDDGTSCWEDVKTTGGTCSGGACRTWCDGDRDLLGNCYAWNLKTECDPVTCEPIVTTGCGCIVTTLMDRQSCSADEDLVGGLCYPKCVNGTSRTGLSCGGTTAKPSKVLTPYQLQCGDGKVDGAPWGSAGLCYGSIPDGYQRQAAGLLSQECPSGAPDIGVACQRETYTRDPVVALAMGIRDRRHQQTDRTPVTCSQTKLDDPDDLAACNAMLCLPDEMIASGTTADFCVSMCRDSYQPGPNGTCVRSGGGTDINGNAFVDDTYQRRNPFLIDWGTSDVPASTSESTWSMFTSAQAADVDPVVLGSGSVSLSLPTQPPAFMGISTGLGVMRFKQSGSVLDVYMASQNDGAVVSIYGSNGGSNQTLQFIPKSGDGWGLLMFQHSGKVLDVYGASQADGAVVDQWTENGGDNQLVRLEPQSDGWSILRFKHSMKVLGVSGGYTEDGSIVEQQTYSGSDNQKLRFEPI